jgi:DNA uptake protein ComE-like DNA-binding protein
MWKDLFYLTKREKAAVWTLTVLVVLAQGLIWSKAWWMPRLTEALRVGVAGDSLQVAGLEREKGTAFSNEAVGAVERDGNADNTIGQRTAPPRPFNPNRADSVTLRQAGLSEKVVTNLLKYRRKGGSFRKQADVAKIYGMTPEDMARIGASLVFDVPETTTKLADPMPSNQPDASRKPSISSPDDPSGSARLETPSAAAASRSLRETTALVATETVAASDNSPSEVDIALFELNTVDTTQLQCLKGVGPVTANRIIRYRQQLGGYYHVAQLAEIKGLYPDVLARLQASLTVDPTRVIKLNLNKASLEKLKTHPYLDFYQAKVIVELRKARKGLKSLDELASFKEFTQTDLERLKWYVAW